MIRISQKFFLILFKQRLLSHTAKSMGHPGGKEFAETSE
jgi:hypothetical protein